MAHRQGSSDEEFRAEVEAHVALEADRLIADGFSPEDAAITARRTFGNLTRVRERFYESRRLMWLEDVRQDTRFAFRSLRRSPGFTAVALLTLAIGLGANTAIFSVVNAVLLRPLAYSAPDQLILIEHPPLGGSPPWLRDAWRARTHTLADFAGFERSSSGTLVTGNQPMHVGAAHVTSNFFPLLGIMAALGRTFSVADAHPGAPAVAVLTHNFWVRRFGGSPEVIGRTVTLTDVTVTGEARVIVGVLPPDFHFPVADPPGNTPLFAGMQPDVIVLSRDDAWQQVLGRLSPGSTPAAASAELSGIFKQEASAHYAARLVERTQVVATPLQDRLVGDTRQRLLLLMAAVGCVLLVVCANIANLLLARVTGRQPEFAIRAALGARTGRLIRMILTESLLLAGFGAVAALLLAYWGNGVLRSMLAARVSHVETVPIDWWVLAFNTVLAAATGVLSGLASLMAIRSRGFAGATNRAGRSVTGRTRLRQGLLAAEVAVVLVLVLTAALLSQTLWNLQHSKRGFDGDRLLTAGVMPGMSGTIPELQNLTSTFFDRVIEQIGRVPGVESVAAASTVPFSGPTMGMSGVSIIGRPPVSESGTSVSVAAVTPGYFATMRNRLMAGRDFSRLDLPDRDRVTVVNEAFVRALASDLPLLGTQIQFGRSQLTVIGIAEDTPDTSLRQPARPFVYVPLAQTVGSQFVFARLTILARARTGDPAALIPFVREAVWALGHDIVIDEINTMDDRLAAAVRTERDSSVLFGLLAAIALLVAVAGVYGVVAYSVSQRTREMGIRIALGARHRQVVGDIVRESAWPVAIGIALGLAGAAVAARATASVLFEIQPTDPATYVAMALALSLTALTAAWIPARRAARVDPVTALRAE
jgi:putative ABC transport system permease protein